MTLRLFDSATRELRDFTPRVPGEVGLYVCGATPQSPPHIGHLRTFVAFDVLVRWLPRTGNRVTYVRNVTDIDDKILAKAAEHGEHWWAWAQLHERLFPAVEALRHTLDVKATAYEHLVKTGRTHLQDATPITLGQEIGAWVSQLDFGLQAVRQSLGGLYDLAIGGTAVGTGLNAHPQFGERTAWHLEQLTGHPFRSAPDKFFALAAHDVGWPFARGGAQALSDALASMLRSLGGRIETGQPVHRLGALPPARVYLFDTAPGELAGIAGDHLPRGYRRALLGYRHGPAVFKLDYALSGPVPWTAPECRRAGTVHLGPTVADIDAALQSVRAGTAPPQPFLIIAQPTLFDPSRAPAGSHILWAYSHVPNGWNGDPEILAAAVESRIERFAPGFRDLVLGRAVTTPATLAARNANYVGGDIGGGRGDGLHLLFRPTLSASPYATPNPAIYLCSAATPPGPGVHGMAGFHAARLALRRQFPGSSARGSRAR